MFKYIATILVVLLLLSIVSSSVDAKVLLINGVSNPPTSYKKLSEAVSAATTGDTLFIMPGIFGTDETADVTIGVRIVLLGSGYKKVANGGTLFQANINFAAGASGSKVSGLRLLSKTLVIADNCNDMVISGNLFTYPSSGYYTGLQVGSSNGSTNDTIRYNLFLNCGVNAQSANTIAVFNNNVFQGYTNSVNYSAIGAIASYYGATVTIFNNLFCASGQPALAAIGTNSFVGSNIFFKEDVCPAGASFKFYGNVVYSNPYSTYIPSASMTWTLTTSDPLFTSYNATTGFAYNEDANDSDLRLKTTPSLSPAIDKGADYQGTGMFYPGYYDVIGLGGLGDARADCGIYGGPWPMPSPYGAPTIPTVTSLTIDKGLVSPSGTITINATGSITKTGK
jgi:hypothetical protein